MLTTIYMRRDHLITSEHERYISLAKNNMTFSEDLASLLENIRLGKKTHGEYEATYLLKLTKDEIHLVTTKDENYLNTLRYLDPDVSEEEMKLSASNSKYVLGEYRRRTFAAQFWASDDSIWPGLYQ